MAVPAKLGSLCHGADLVMQLTHLLNALLHPLSVVMLARFGRYSHVMYADAGTDVCIRATLSVPSTTCVAQVQ